MTDWSHIKPFWRRHPLLMVVVVHISLPVQVAVYLPEAFAEGWREFLLERKEAMSYWRDRAGN